MSVPSAKVSGSAPALTLSPGAPRELDLPGLPPTPSLRLRVLRGASAIAVQNVVAKIIGILSQLVTARLLAAEDFGLIGLALTVTAFSTLLQDAGLSQVLIRRSRRFALWSTPAFWMSLASGIGVMLLIWGISPLAVRFYHEPKLTLLLLVLSLACPLSACAMLPAAALNVSLKFKTLGAITCGVVIVQSVLTIILAWSGFGAVSFAIPVTVAAALRTALLWMASPVRVSLWPRFRRWRYLLADGSSLVAATSLATITTHADYIILGRYDTAAAVGTYYFAFNLANQATLILAGATASTLLPVLSNLRRNPLHQITSYERVARPIAMVGVPFSILQAAVAAPSIRALFGDKWIDAVPLFQIISLAMAFQFLNVIASALLLAQGRFGVNLRVTAVFAAVLPVVIWLGVRLGGARGAAYATLLYAVMNSLVLPSLATRPAGRSLVHVARLYVEPLGLSILPAVAAGSLVVLVPLSPWPLATLATATFAVIYGVSIYLWTPRAFGEIVAVLRSR